MALTTNRGITIKGIVNVVPRTVEDNLELALLDSKEREALILHTGIRFRRVADSSHTILAYFNKAVDQLLQRTGWSKADVDILLCVTQSPNMVIPSVSCRLHGDMGFDNKTMCYDINSGCSGFVYGLHTISSLLQTIDGKHKKAILVCGDLSTHLIDSEDKSVRPIFSDAVSAIAIECSSEDQKISGYFNLGTDGTGQHAIEIDHEDGQGYMKLNGIDVFGYSVQRVPRNITDLLSFANRETDFADLLVMHQANKVINESIRKKLNVDEVKVPYSIYEYGNTASASIPITLSKAWDSYQPQSGWILIAGFGVGFSMASGLIKFEPNFCDKPIEF
ncbi:MAG TPA: ketoacyl-ACP synthase III [Taishania sp.]|nr:ketoacyl-ACP synthase III [Taishania sp.]